MDLEFCNDIKRLLKDGVNSCAVYSQAIMKKPPEMTCQIQTKECTARGPRACE